MMLTEIYMDKLLAFLLEYKMKTYSSVLALEIPWTEETVGLQTVVTKNRT